MIKLFYKNGAFSKTALLLIFSFILVSIKYFTAGVIFNKLIFPEFDSDSALTFLGITAALYFSTHNIQLKLDRSYPVPDRETPYYRPPENEKEYRFSTTPSESERK